MPSVWRTEQVSSPALSLGFIYRGSGPWDSPGNKLLRECSLAESACIQIKCVKKVVRATPSQGRPQLNLLFFFSSLNSFRFKSFPGIMGRATGMSVSYNNARRSLLGRARSHLFFFPDPTAIRGERVAQLLRGFSVCERCRVASSSNARDACFFCSLFCMLLNITFAVNFCYNLIYNCLYYISKKLNF